MQVSVNVESMSPVLEVVVAELQLLCVILFVNVIVNKISSVILVCTVIKYDDVYYLCKSSLSYFSLFPVTVLVFECSLFVLMLFNFFAMIWIVHFVVAVTIKFKNT